ncbi:antA/AntB antirepressor family protein [Flavobacterium columnare]|uniref:antA/AntB antirepressor family protein n=1 Tax=Flavobacterium columnare TaxID=996 RepID=UPI0040340908
MNQLINITNQNGTSVVSARDLHQFLEVKTEFKDWIARRIEEYGFVEDVDFVLLLNFEQQKGRGGHNRKEYAITLDMAKELSMVEKTDKGREARRYFIAVEKKAHTPQLEEQPVPLQIKIKEVELLHAIRQQLNYGDLAQVARDLGVSIRRTSAILSGKSKSKRILEALYQKALSNKNLPQGIQTKIDLLN